MVNLFEITVNVIEEFITVMFLMLYFGNKHDNIWKYIGFIAAVTSSAAMTTFFNSLYTYEEFLGLAYIIVYTVYTAVFLKGDIYTKIFVCGFINSIVYFIALFSALCISIIYNQNNYQIYNMGSDRIVVIVISKVLLLAACMILLKFRFTDVGGNRNMVILITMPVVVDISIIGIMRVFLKYSELKNELLLASISIMAAGIITYYMFIKINKDIKREIKIKAYEQKEEYDRKHANEIEELYSKTCNIRHDLLHHFTMINGLLNESKEKASEYIQLVTQEQIQQINRFIKTDNTYFDAIVNAKLAVCEKKGLKVRVRVMDNALTKLNNYEIASLFGNLFDNAIEASQYSKDKCIDLDVQLQDDHLSVFMRNTIDKSVLDTNRYLKTTKSDKERHGLGTKNIQKIVDEKKGFVNYFEENGYFNCDIYL